MIVVSDVIHWVSPPSLSSNTSFVIIRLVRFGGRIDCDNTAGHQRRVPLRPPKTARSVDTSMTLVAGIDIQSIEEVQTSIGRFGDRYLRRIFSDRELRECETVAHNVAGSLATRFAAKEAVIKVLRVDDTFPPWRTIEGLIPPSGAPKVVLNGVAERLARANGVEGISLSVSVARDYAVAAVVADVTRLGEPTDRVELRSYRKGSEAAE